MKKLVVLLCFLAVTLIGKSQLDVQDLPFHEPFSSSIDFDVWDTTTYGDLYGKWEIDSSDPLEGSYCLVFSGSSVIGNIKMLINLENIDYTDPLKLRVAFKNYGDLPYYSYDHMDDILVFYELDGDCDDIGHVDTTFSNKSSNWTNLYYDLPNYIPECAWGEDQVYLQFSNVTIYNDIAYYDNIYVYFDIDDHDLGSIMGDSLICGSEGSKTYTVSNPVDPDYNCTYEWYYTGSYTGSLLTGASITITPLTVGILKVRAVNGFVKTDLVEELITVDEPETPVNLYGSTEPCYGGSTYSTDEIQGATSYTWSCSIGYSSCESGCATNECVYIFGPGSGFMKVKANNSCGSSGWKYLYNLSPAPPPNCDE